MKNINALISVFCGIMAIFCFCTSMYGFYEGYWFQGIVLSIWTLTFCLHTYTFKCYYEIDKMKGK